MKYSKEKIAALIEGIYDGSITERELPESLYFAIADHLKESLYKGFGGTLTEFEGAPLKLLGELRENIYMFSGAKTYTQVRELTDALSNEEGLRSFKDFKETALEIYDKYNVNYLRTEYDTAIASGQQGYLWTEIEANKDVLPYLQFTAVIDQNTTDECEHMNGVTAKVDDPIWNTCYPPNHFNCRSSVLQVDSGLSSESEISKAERLTKGEMQDEFKMNVGKDGYVFKEDHPYFSVPKEDIDFAQNNFNLPIPDKDE